MKRKLKKIFVLSVFIALLFALSDIATAETVTWTGLGSDNKASTGANWSRSNNQKPQNMDSIIFDETSSKDCEWDYDAVLSSVSVSEYEGKISKEPGIWLLINKVTSHVWTGLGGDMKASTAENWSGNVVPHEGDTITLLGINSKNMIWDLIITPALINIGDSYLGTITLEQDPANIGNVNIDGGTFNLNGKQLNVLGDLDIGSNGALNAGTSTIDVKGNWFNEGTFEEGSSLVRFSGSNQVIVGSTTFHNLEKNNVLGTVTLSSLIEITGDFVIAEGTMNLNDKNISVGGFLEIGVEGVLIATSSTIQVQGDWSNEGAFFPDTSTVILIGTGQTVWGDNTFFNLIKTGPGDTLKFEADKEQTVLNTLTLQGAEGAPLAIRSTSPGVYWFLDAQGSRNLNFLNIEYLYNLNFVDIVLLDDCTGSNNEFVRFGGALCVAE